MKKGDRFRIISENESYEAYRDKIWTVNRIFTSMRQHPGYDEELGQKLYEAKGLPFVVYEYEVKEV